MQTAAQTLQSKLYNPRHPERSLLHQTIAEHYETWLDLASAGQFEGQGCARARRKDVLGTTQKPAKVQ